MKKRFAASAMILAMSAATVLSPLTAFAEAEEQELNIAIFQGGYGDAYWNQMVELFEESHEGEMCIRDRENTKYGILR